MRDKTINLVGNIVLTILKIEGSVETDVLVKLDSALDDYAVVLDGLVLLVVVDMHEFIHGDLYTSGRVRLGVPFKHLLGDEVEEVHNRVL